MLPDGYQIGRRIPFSAWVFSVRREGGEPKKPKRRQMGWAARVAARHDSTEASSVGINHVLFRTLDELTPWKAALSN